MACAEQRGPAGRSIVEYERTWEALLQASLAHELAESAKVCTLMCGGFTRLVIFHSLTIVQP